MNSFAKILGVIISFGVIASAVAGTLYHFEKTKVGIEEYQTFVKNHKQYCAYTDIRFLEQYRRTLQQRIWDLQRRYPSTYNRLPEYLNLIQELRNVDMKIKAFYSRGGR